jgi:hypothetical protein
MGGIEHRLAKAVADRRQLRSDLDPAQKVVFR